VGMFINMLPLRTAPEDEKTFAHFLDEVKEIALGAFENQDYQYDMLVRKLNLQGKAGKSPLFEMEYTHQNIGSNETQADTPDSEFNTYGSDSLKARFDLSLHSREIDDFIEMAFIYTEALFKRSTIEELGKHFIEVLEQALDNGDIKLQDIAISYESEIGRYNKEREYWMKQMAGEPEKCTFPPSYCESTRHAAGQLYFDLPAGVASKICKLSKGLDHTIHIILTAGIVLLLNKYSHDAKKDIIVGAPVYKQENDVQLTNTVLALRAKLTGDITFKELLMQMRRTVIEADEHQDYPIETLLYQLDLEASEAGFPLFDVAVLLESIHHKAYLEDIRHNITFAFAPVGESISGTIEYNAALYREEAVESIVRHYGLLMESLLSDPDAPLSAVDILGEEEKKTLLSTFNDTAAQYPRRRSIDQQLDDIAAATPDKIALVYEEEQLTYRMLKRQALGLTTRLRQQGVTPGNIVGLMTERSIEMIGGILGIIYAGAAYLPLAVDYPRERVNYLLTDSNAALLLTSNAPKEENPYPVKIVGFFGAEESSATPGPVNQPGSIAYTIYTSGSTGRPKGVVLTHRNVNNLVFGLGRKIYSHYPEGQPLRVALVAPYIFDASVQQIFGALLSGHALHVVPEATRADG
ncbi:MAG: non-ribosomal peptide synthetase, partial [bacterium]|nr:non-ribosomal peptide synthetase [bacterium]